MAGRSSSRDALLVRPFTAALMVPEGDRRHVHAVHALTGAASRGDPHERGRFSLGFLVDAWPNPCFAGRHAVHQTPDLPCVACAVRWSCRSCPVEAAIARTNSPADDGMTG